MEKIIEIRETNNYEQNRTEQKGRLTDIIEDMENAVSAVKNNRDFYSEAVESYSTLYEKLQDEGFVDVLEQDVNGFTASLMKSILNGQADLETIQSNIGEFKDDIEAYADELNEARSEKLMERYGDLEEVYDSIYALTSDDDVTLDSVVDELEEKIVWLKEMKK